MEHFGEKVSFIWSIADLIRDTFKRGKYQDVMLPLTVLRRIDCVLEPTKPHVLEMYMLCNKATISHFTAEKVQEVPVMFPPPSEQRTITSFLDHETSHINTLIAKKERLIELLTEKRSALISHTVTKGLDPTVPMKNSGVEWLGQIPAHWHAAPCYAYYNVQLGKMLDTKRISGEYLPHTFVISMCNGTKLTLLACQKWISRLQIGSDLYLLQVISSFVKVERLEELLSGTAS